MIIKPHHRERLISCYLKHLSRLMGKLEYVASRALLSINFRSPGTKLCLSSIRHGYHSAATNYLARSLENNAVDLEPLLSAPCEEEEILDRMIVLSPPVIADGCICKGVLLVKFTTSFSYLMKHSSWNEINKQFLFVLEPSWSGYADADILLFMMKAEHCIVQAAEIKDRALLNTVLPNVPSLDIGSGNWVDHRIFHSDGASPYKTYDLIYIANLNPIKRVYKLIDDVNKVTLEKSDFKALIVCSDWGTSSIQDFIDYTKKKGLDSNVEITGSKTHPELSNLLRMSKLSVLMSLKEGSNRSIFESMFCGTPVICLSENVGVNKSYINSSTGILTTDSTVDLAIRYLEKNFNLYNPREWAMANISPEKTTTFLSGYIARRFGRSVNANLEIKINNPEANYMNLSLDKLSINRYIFENINKKNPLDFSKGINELFSQ